MTPDMEQVVRAPLDQRDNKAGLAMLLPYIRGEAKALAVVVLLSTVGSIATLVQPFLARTVLDRIGLSRPVGAQVVVLLLVLVGGSLLSGIRDYLLQRTAEGLVLSVRRKLTSHLLRLPIAEYDQRRTGDLLSRVSADTTLLQAVVTSGLLDLASSAFIIVGAAWMMILLDPLMFLVAAGGLMAIFAAVLVARQMRGVSEQAQVRVGELTSAVERALSAVRTIRASRGEERESAAVAESARQAYGEGLRLARLQALIGPVMAVASEGTFLLVLGIGGYRVHSNAISIGDLVAFVLLLFLLMAPIGQALGTYAQLQAGLGALQRVEDVLRLPAETAHDLPVRVLNRTTTPALAIEFAQVTFSYGAEDPVLQDVSFAVPYGSCTALVGPSGVGKSTLLALAERFYDVAAGSVRIAGVDVRDYDRQELRGQLGYVEQEAPVLAGTIRENLLINAPKATDEQIHAVLAELNLMELSRRNPEGLGAKVGEGGVLLSGGERQRLAVARVLLAAPPILLFDEPTSNLDTRNETAVRQAIENTAGLSTLLVAAHRISTVVDCDQIVVLDGGRVVAIGHHDELIVSSALYRELAAQQLRR